MSSLRAASRAEVAGKPAITSASQMSTRVSNCRVPMLLFDVLRSLNPTAQDSGSTPISACVSVLCAFVVFGLMSRDSIDPGDRIPEEQTNVGTNSTRGFDPNAGRFTPGVSLQLGLGLFPKRYSRYCSIVVADPVLCRQGLVGPLKNALDNASNSRQTVRLKSRSDWKPE